MVSIYTRIEKKKFPQSWKNKISKVNHEFVNSLLSFNILRESTLLIEQFPKPKYSSDFLPNCLLRHYYCLGTIFTMIEYSLIMFT